VANQLPQLAHQCSSLSPLGEGLLRKATVRYPRSSESLDPFRGFRAGAKATEAKTLSDEGFRTATAEV